MNVEFIVTVTIVAGLMTLLDSIAFKKWRDGKDILTRIEYLEAGQSILNDNLCDLEERVDTLDEEVF